MAGHDDILTINEDNRREFSRVSACVPFSFRIVPPTDACYLQSRIITAPYTTDFSTMPSMENQMYGEWLKLINAKLDEVIRMLTMQKEGFSTLPFQKISISGSGISFLSNDSVQTGTVLEIRVILTSLNTTALYLYGEVVTVERYENNYHIGVRFMNMDDMIRNEVVRFVFEREREMIREKRGI